jgi:hypothetical protein
MMNERTKEKLAWWIVKYLPKRVVLYAFCTVHGITGDGPAYDGEYAIAYRMWTERHGLK